MQERESSSGSSERKLKINRLFLLPHVYIAYKLVHVGPPCADYKIIKVTKQLRGLLRGTLYITISFIYRDFIYIKKQQIIRCNTHYKVTHDKLNTRIFFYLGKQIGYTTYSIDNANVT